VIPVTEDIAAIKEELDNNTVIRHYCDFSFAKIVDYGVY